MKNARKFKIPFTSMFVHDYADADVRIIEVSSKL